MQVAELWRYPVKSLRGEPLDAVEVTPHGFVGDRRFGLLDPATGQVLTARREPRLLFLQASWLPSPDGSDPEAGTVAIRDDEGNLLPDDDALSGWLGRPVELRRAGAEGGTYENPDNPFEETDWFSWQGPGWAWHDSSNTRVSLVSTATLGTWPLARFRANVLLDGAKAAGDEDALVGQHVRIGTTGLGVGHHIPRCVMVTRPQPGLQRDLDVLRTIHTERGGNLAISAVIDTIGTITVGDVLEPVTGPFGTP